MAWNTYISDDETCKIWVDTVIGKVKIEDLENEEEWTTPIGQDGADDIDANIVPGFKAGKWMIYIGKKIKEALT